MIFVGLKEDIRGQMVKYLANAKFPINSVEDLIAYFPQEPEVVCHLGNSKVMASDLMRIIKKSDFPLKTPEHVAMTLIRRTGI